VLKILKRMNKKFKFIDLFAGIGGMRIPFEELGCKCVYSSEWDSDARKIYFDNFGDMPNGDITKIHSKDIPNHDILLAGFPCQAFSIIGKMNGFNDTRGTLYFHIERILREKQPDAFVLENVKMLVRHRRGRTFNTIIESLNDAGYKVNWKILNALHFGLPHKRERVFIVGFKKKYNFQFPLGSDHLKSLSDILEENVPKKYYASEKIILKRKQKHSSIYKPSIWHENKSGNISSYPYSCALRANASYNYLLVNGERRLTPRECLRLLGFPESFKLDCSYSAVRKLTGNSVCVPVVRSVAEKVLNCLKKKIPEKESNAPQKQLNFFYRNNTRK
jgi:DNA (cytosine-5)-methyltransferase 1